MSEEDFLFYLFKSTKIAIFCYMKQNGLTKSNELMNRNSRRRKTKEERGNLRIEIKAIYDSGIIEIEEMTILGF